MFGWLRKLLGQKPTEVFPELECKVPVGEGHYAIRTYRIKGAHGLHYLIGDVAGSEERLLGPDDAVDADRFWALWRHYNVGIRLMWGDGSVAKL